MRCISILFSSSFDKIYFPLFCKTELPKDRIINYRFTNYMMDNSNDNIQLFGSNVNKLKINFKKEIQ